MLDALLPFAESLRQAALQQRPIRDGLWDAVNAAERGAEQTAQMVPRRGRSSYIGERALGHPDPGAVAVAIELRAVVQKLLG
jgi:dihydroxyacetone kinase